MKKIMRLLFIATALITTTSCDSGDDLPTGPSIQVNSFCYGDQTTNFVTVGAFRGETLQVSNTGIRTQVTILGDGVTLNDMDELEGAGSLIQLSFYGDSLDGFQTGLYEISNLEESANVAVSYSVTYDAAVPLQPVIRLVSGNVRVQPYATGYAITIDGLDENGDEFHGIYLGNVPIIP